MCDFKSHSRILLIHTCIVPPISNTDPLRETLWGVEYVAWFKTKPI